MGTAKDENAVPRVRVEAIDRLHEPEARDLHQIIERLPRAAVAAGELPGEREKALDEFFACPLVAVALPTYEQ